jgi:hypothetical protein
VNVATSGFYVFVPELEDTFCPHGRIRRMPVVRSIMILRDINIKGVK